MFQSYSKFYNDQIKERENFLISKKVELANKLSLMDEYKKNIKRLQKKLVDILKSIHHFQYEYSNPSKNLKRENKNPKSQKNLSQKHINFINRHRALSFEVKIEKDSDLKESKFYYKMTLLQLAHQNSKSSHKNSTQNPENTKFTRSQKSIKNENETKTNPEIRRKTISVVMNHFNRSPSLLLKFSNNNNNTVSDFLSFKHDSNEKNNELWQKNILPLMKNKQNREKFIKEVQSTLKKSHIPSKLRGTIWCYVF